jgi:hypothetical protein
VASPSVLPRCPTGPAEGWRVVAASVRGTSHVKANLPCQDVLLWQALPAQRLLGVLADGAGSASFAEVGADAAARVARDIVAARFAGGCEPATDDDWKTLLRDALKAARAAVLAAAEKQSVRPRELASTLTVLIVGPELAAAAQVGDGVALVADAADALAALTKPSSGEFLNETTFLTSDTALDQPQIEIRRGRCRHTALLCDGLQLLALKFPELTPHAPFFAPLFRYFQTGGDLAAAPGQLAAFLQSPRIRQRADDDLSLLLAWLPED